MLRRRVLLGAAGAAALLTAGPTASAVRADWGRFPLLSSTVALRGPGQRVLIPARGGEAVLPGTRIAASAPEPRVLHAAEDEVRAAAATAAGQADLGSGHSAALTQAALDLHVLSAGLAAPVAAWPSGWRYVWPRDAAHVAVALAQLGLTARAAGIIRELAHLIGADGWFQARYLPGARTVPDARTPQLDGSGWFLWALDQVVGTAPQLRRDPAVDAAAQAALGLLMRVTGGPDHLPPASPDYWELPESRTTIAGAALVAVGLERGARILGGRAGRSGELAARAAERAEVVREAIRSAFGPTGYSRYAGAAGADAGMLFLLPPYALAPDPAVATHVAAARRHLARPAGGVAPGQSWRADGISWTPQTALFAKSGAPGTAPLLDWLISHRTGHGSLPEKVLADGSCASVAPLAWTAALLIGGLIGGG